MYTELHIVRADPAGNITIFVLNPPDSAEECTEAAKMLLADKDLAAEQIGFVYLPALCNEVSRARLEMAGGELCGNASRSFGLLVAALTGLSGAHTLTIKTSGISQSVPVNIDTEAHTAEIALPAPVVEKIITLDGLHFSVYVFEGITHIIAENILPDEKLARSLIRTIDEPCKALGVMFYDSQKRFMRPAVWVPETDTLFFESSCGSGSAALGVWAVRDTPDARTSIELAQPGGVITVRVTKQAGNITHLSIGGKVTLSEVMRWRGGLIWEMHKFVNRVVQ